jgi:hypothetical protein
MTTSRLLGQSCAFGSSADQHFQGRHQLIPAQSASEHPLAVEIRRPRQGIDNSIELGRIFARSVTVRRYSTAT